MLLTDILKKYWGHSSFRPLQEDIIRSVMEGKDTLALLPTGGGKSICFQVPGMVREGMCLVISPLIALMKDQVQHLKEKGIEAFALYSGLTGKETELIFNHCGHNTVKFLYVSPERLENRDFIIRLKQWKINLLAVDEAHCVSQWGYDFRPPYLKIADIRQHLQGVPVLALTATAVPAVVEDIQQRLGFPVQNVFKKSFHRSNLAYMVLKEEDKKNRLLRIINKTKGTGIIYVRNRKKTGEIANFLVKNGISATFYHAGLEGIVRSERQENWMKGKSRVMVATNAFGMGIDKPDVRFVVHMDLPDTLEAYFQEAGRAGRDEKDSYSVILFDDLDISNLKANFTLGWPDPGKIRNIYLALFNYARIPMNSGNGLSVEFELSAFCSQYKLNPVTVFKVLSFLEKEGYILLQEDILAGSKIHLICSREELYQVQLQYAYLDEIIKVLLRSYGGLFSDYININEKELARRCDLDENIVVKSILQLQNLGILDYIQKAEKPLLIFCRDRMDEKYIAINQTNYLSRKEVAKGRLDAVIQYISLSNHCRSGMLLKYFGESSRHACGKCDVCLKSKNRRLDEKDFLLMSGMIRQSLNRGPLSLSELISSISSCSEKEIITVISWMAENEQIQIDNKKIVSLID
jgi:ATP-dependent DNA helicase RecQ